MLIFIKHSLIYIRNVLVWLAPLLFFCFALFVVVFFLQGDLTKYIQLLEILIWPVTLLVGLFFFRKVVTFMFFSMDEFNFFGAKGNLKNVHEIINEEVDKKFIQINEEKLRKEEMVQLEAKLNNTSASAEENARLAREFYEIYKEYKKNSQKKVQKLNFEIKNLRDNISQTPSMESSTPSVVENETVADLGSGEVIGNLDGTEPKI